MINRATVLHPRRPGVSRSPRPSATVRADGVVGVTDVKSPPRHRLTIFGTVDVVGAFTC
jgi:hypothetical protein